MKSRRSIAPITIRGEKEFADAFGIKDPRTQARLRAEGLPCMHDGSMYVYDPVKVLDWMEKKWGVQQPISL